VSHLVRIGADEAEMTRRLTADADEFRGRAGCKTLVAFVYDPERRLPDPQRLEAVWSQPERIRCVIAS